MRGPVAEAFLAALAENFTLKTLDLSYNLFGISHDASIPPAATKLSEILVENNILEELNLSNNLIDSKVAFCLAHGLRNNTSLKSFIMDGNPIGSAGVKYLIQSINCNDNGKVENIKMKETELIVQRSDLIGFDPMDVEKEYELQLQDIYGRVVLYHLLDIDEKIRQNSSEDEGIEQGE